MTAPDVSPEPGPQPLKLDIRAIALKRLIAKAEEILEEQYVKPLQVTYPFPGTWPAESPLDGAKIGHINRARTTPRWTVTSLEQLTDYFTRKFPAVLETVFLLDVPGVGQPVALPEDHPITIALAQAAPDLLTPQQRVPEQVIADALEQSAADGVAAAPGIQLIRKGQGALSIVWDKKEADGALDRLARSGQFSFASLLALGPATEAEAS